MALGLVGVLLSAAAVITPALGVAGAALAGVGLVAQYRSGSGPVVIDFTLNDWHQRPADSGQWVIEIPAEVHGRREPIASCWRRFDDHMGRVWLEPEVLLDNTIRLTLRDKNDTDGRFAGQVKIT